tara:strand:+ start:83 stop:319 length:237 start_codon:yes stop_codon:yes gene_type:complete
MPRGRKKKYVRPKLDCSCFYCDKEVEYPYIHIALTRQDYGDTKITAPAGTVIKNRDLPNANTSYYCDTTCYQSHLEQL